MKISINKTGNKWDQNYMKKISHKTETNFTNLTNYLSTLKSAAIAYSGGVDSTLLLHIASTIPGLKVTAFTVKNALVPGGEILSALTFVKNSGIEYRLIDIDIFSYNDITCNSTERCYYCKTVLMEKIISASEEYGINTVLEGSHLDDTYDYRPGMKAIENLGIITPLKNAGFDKAAIYELSEYLDLPTSKKESLPCLATRIPYGTPLTPESLQRAELAEKILASFGFRQIRARIHGEILRIEIAENMIPEISNQPMRGEIISALKKAGFIYITVDLQGYRTGSMNINTGENHN